MAENSCDFPSVRVQQRRCLSVCAFVLHKNHSKRMKSDFPHVQLTIRWVRIMISHVLQVELNTIFFEIEFLLSFHNTHKAVRCHAIALFFPIFITFLLLCFATQVESFHLCIVRVCVRCPRVCVNVHSSTMNWITTLPPSQPSRATTITAASVSCYRNIEIISTNTIGQQLLEICVSSLHSH